MSTSPPAGAGAPGGTRLRVDTYQARPAFAAFATITALTALAALPVQAQTPTGQTYLSLTASAYHDTQFFWKDGLPGTPLSARLDAADVTGAPDNSYGSMQFATAVGEVSGTLMKLRSFARAYAWTQTGFYGAGALAEANASALVPFRFDDPTRTGQRGTMVAPLLVTGDVVLDRGFYDPVGGSSADGRAYVMLWGSGFGALDCGSNGANHCLDITSNYAGTVTKGQGATGSLLMQVPFVFGDWTQVHLQMWTRVRVDVSAGPGGGYIDHHGDSDFSHTLRWGGISSVLDSSGQPIADWTIQSVPGVDLTVAAVPEPQQWALWLCGLVGLGALSHRRRAVAPAA